MMMLAIAVLLQGDALEAYRRLDFGQRKGAFDDVCRTRLHLEQELIRAGKPAPLRAALKDEKRDVRAFAATALGVLGDRASAPVLAELARKDPEPMVRGMALQSLGWLKTGAEAMEAARQDASADVKFLAEVARAELKSPVDFAKAVREGYQIPLKPEEMGRAKAGMPAPDFTATDTAGKPFKLSERIGQEIVILVFQLADW